LDLRFLTIISAVLALFQKSGAYVFSSSLAISICLASRSKIPPQRTKALHNPLYLFGCCHKLIFFLIANILKIADFTLQVFRFIRNNSFAQIDQAFSCCPFQSAGSSFVAKPAGFPLPSGLAKNGLFDR
jgi:hypothetical protein